MVPTTQALEDELRQNLFPRVLIPLILAGMVLILLDPSGEPPPSISSFAFLLLLFATFLSIVRWNHILFFLMVSLGTLVFSMLAWIWFPNKGVEGVLIFPFFMAMITLGTRAGVFMAVLITFMLIAGIRWSSSSGSISTVLVVEGGILWGLVFIMLTWKNAYGRLITWTWQQYDLVRCDLEKARDTQLELKQALEDLALANQQTVRLNEMLNSARKALEDARHAKEEFVANVSHELRTPLNMIIGFSDMILETPHVYARRLPATLLADVAAIKRNSQHLASLVDDILDLAEADTGRMKLFKEWTSLQRIAQEAIEAISALFEKKGLTLTVHIAENLPAIYCDHARIRQVLLNLLSNAGRFTNQGGTRVEACLQGGMILTTVTDTGHGIASQHLERLFQPFQQSDQSIRRRFGGSGLGLAISKRFVEMHGGRIWLESTVGMGTRACFTLPLLIGVPVDAPKRWFSPYQEYTVRTRPSAAPQIASKPCVVMMEERNSTIGNPVESHLDALEIIRVYNMEEAREQLAKSAAIALIVNGTSETLTSRTEISSLSFDIPILSFWMPNQRTMVNRAGAQDYLVKPVFRTDLLNSINRVAPQSRTILLADDDPETRQLFERMLVSTNRDWTIIHAVDGATTLALMRESRPDLLLLDLVMPNGDGFSVLEAKNADPKLCDIPVIVMSAKDPQQEPIVAPKLSVTRRDGLSARDLALAIQALTCALQPRFAPVQPESRDAWQASE